MALVTYGKILKAKFILANRKAKYKVYAQGKAIRQSGVKVSRTKDQGFTRKEAKQLLATTSNFQKALPRLHGGPTRKTSLNQKIKVSGQALKALKFALNKAPSSFDAKLKRPLNVRLGLGQQRQIPLEKVQFRREVLNRRKNRVLKQIATGSGNVRQAKSRLKYLTHALKHIVPVKERTVRVPGKIYKFTEKKTGRVYIGQTISTVEARAADHIRHGQHPFDRVLKRKGMNAFTLETIAKATTKKKLNTLERKFIAKYDSANPRKGFNTLAGNYNAKLRQRVQNVRTQINRLKKKSQSVRKLKKVLRTLRGL